MNQANPDPGAAMDLGKKSAEDAPDTAAQDMGYWSGMLFQVIVDKKETCYLLKPTNVPVAFMNVIFLRYPNYTQHIHNQLCRLAFWVQSSGGGGDSRCRV